MCTLLYIIHIKYNWMEYVFTLKSGDLKKNSVLALLTFLIYCFLNSGFPGGAAVKNLPANAGAARDKCLTPESGRSPGVGNGNPLQYSCLENLMDRGAWWAPVNGVTKSRT